jgi:hypothetical protein
MYLASWKAKTRKSIGRANFTANNKRLSNGMICRKYPMRKSSKDEVRAVAELALPVVSKPASTPENTGGSICPDHLEYLSRP